MTFSFTEDVQPDGTVSSLDAAIYQAIGAASVCWTTVNDERIFDEEHAKSIAVTLSWFVREWGASYIMKKADEPVGIKQSQPDEDDRWLKMEIISRCGHSDITKLEEVYKWVKGV